MVVSAGGEARARGVASRWPLASRLPVLVQRARAATRRSDRATQARRYLVGSDYGSLPDPAQYPDLVRVFVDAQRDYLEDRLYLIGARVVGPRGSFEVVEMTDAPPGHGRRARAARRVGAKLAAGGRARGRVGARAAARLHLRGARRAHAARRARAPLRRALRHPRLLRPADLAPRALAGDALASLRGGALAPQPRARLPEPLRGRARTRLQVGGRRP